ncbi:MAG: phospholipid carrier-dependent glycosyltransferase [Solobacterium sp.]|nr:phospholipid carrier-dependent glycosyltransferase [Solobacterium sp.]
MRQLSLSLFQNSELLILILECVLAALSVYILAGFFPYVPKKKRDASVSALSFVRTSSYNEPLKKKDLQAMAVITAVYAVISLHLLGSPVFPSTTWQPSSGTEQTVIFTLPEETKFDAVYAISGEGDNNALEEGWQLGFHDIAIYGSNDLQIWEQTAVLEKTGIYHYSITYGNWDYRYIKLVSKNSLDTVTEIGLRNLDHFVKIEVYKDDCRDSLYPAALMIDEQERLSIDPVYYAQGYFDEVYHPRNAWEIANGQDMYATVHPLLGTNLMALSIKLFGMSPLAWRLPGAIAGICMIPVMYLLCMTLFASTFASVCGSVLLAGDFMHITTSRIGTLEPFSVLFILIMFLYMARYCRLSFYDAPKGEQYRLLVLSGIFTGIAIAAKWTGCYTAAGLAVILFANWIARGIEYYKAKKLLEHRELLKPRELEEALHIEKTFIPALVESILVCIISFIIVPILIYAFSYIPDRVWKNDTWSFVNVWRQCVYMYKYHANLEATHPYQSTWIQWVLDLRPIWYYYGSSMQGTVHTIACFSNPLLTWAGIPAFFFIVYDVIRHRDRESWMILVGYVSALAPWALLIGRCVFAYHFYPASVFLILAVVMMITKLARDAKTQAAVIVFLVIYVIVFVLFLPVTCGFGTTLDYIHHLEWLDGWYFG